MSLNDSKVRIATGASTFPYNETQLQISIKGAQFRRTWPSWVGCRPHCRCCISLVKACVLARPPWGDLLALPCLSIREIHRRHETEIWCPSLSVVGHPLITLAMAEPTRMQSSSTLLGQSTSVDDQNNAHKSPVDCFELPSMEMVSCSHSCDALRFPKWIY